MISANQRIFTDQFIADQKKLLIAASAKQGALNNKLVNESDLNLILNNMKTVAPSPVEGENVQLSGLLKLINTTKTTLERNNSNRPTVKTLNQILSNIAILLQYNDPRINNEEKQNTVDMEQNQNLQRLFNDRFISNQEQILIAASQQSGQINSVLLNDDDTLKPILENMRKLTYNERGFTSTDPTVNFRYLLTQIDDAMQQFQTTYEKNNCCAGSHPLKAALQVVKANVIAAAKLNASHAVAEDKRQSAERSKQISAARWTRAGKVLGILACSLWYIPEKILTINNCCNNSEGCNNPGDCGMQREHSDIPTLFAPARAIGNYSNEFSSKGREISRLKAEDKGNYQKPIEMKMM